MIRRNQVREENTKNTKAQKFSRIRATALKRLATLETVEFDLRVEEAYSRNQFGHGWRDNDGDGQDERQETLIRYHDSKRGGPLVMESDGDRVEQGLWFCRFTGEWFTDPSDMDIDHFVPLKAAWMSGAARWDRDRRMQYSNGYGIKSKKRRSWLIPVSASANRSKGARGPDEWLPSREAYRVNYAATWIRTKAYWKLTVTAAEADTLKTVLTTEGGTPE